MSREYKLHYPTEANRDQVQKFLASHPKGKEILKVVLQLKQNPRPEAHSFIEIDPKTEITFLIQLPGISVDKDTESILRRVAPRCRIQVEGCDVVYEIDDKDGVVYLFSIHPDPAKP